ncbi:type II toxin-antitoxin system PemK/MazF family toxin [Devosia sp. ZW T5_3]|uniref:type II toxin-antitoxin system PemK/MazF family toxin n=1 Tax=Devosia sp. ZW T5_3 TaxID=3378085 RepID=UPI00385391C6
MVRKQIPERGEIYHLDLRPSSGREQTGKHYVLILTTRDYNATHLPYVAPITTIGNASRFGGTYVSLSGAGTSVTGVIQLDQVKAVDLVARSASKTGEAAPSHIIEDVLARLAAIFE